MKLSKIGFAVGSVGAVLLAVACSSSSGDDSSTPTADSGPGADVISTTDTGPAADTGPSNTCPGKLADGTYTQHNTATADGGPTCPPADTTLTFPTPVVDAGGVDSGPNPCTTTVDLTACSETIACNVPNTFTSHTTIVLASDGLSATGTTTTTVDLPDGGVFNECDYTSTITKN